MGLSERCLSPVHLAQLIDHFAKCQQYHRLGPLIDDLTTSPGATSVAKRRNKTLTASFFGSRVFNYYPKHLSLETDVCGITAISHCDGLSQDWSSNSKPFTFAPLTMWNRDYFRRLSNLHDQPHLKHRVVCLIDLSHHQLLTSSTFTRTPFESSFAQGRKKS